MKNAHTASFLAPCILRLIKWTYLAPALIILLLVFAYPILRDFWLSLFTQNLGTELKAVKG